MIACFVAVSVLAICRPCMCADDLLGQSYTFGDATVRFDHQRGSRTGCIFYDVSGYTSNRNPFRSMAKVYIGDQSLFYHEKNMNLYLFARLGHSKPALLAHGLPLYNSDGLLGEHRVLFMPKTGMTLDEALRLTVPPNDWYIHRAWMMTSMLRLLKAIEFLHKQGITYGFLWPHNIVMYPRFYLEDFVHAQQYPWVTWKGQSYFDFTAEPVKALPQDRLHTPSTDLTQLANVMDTVFQNGIQECYRDGYFFPYQFSRAARAMTGEPDYVALEDFITSCMVRLGMSFPWDLSLYFHRPRI